MNRESIEKMFATAGSSRVIPDVFEGILNLVKPAYTNVDKAHDLNHIEHVIRKGFKIYEYVKNEGKYKDWAFFNDSLSAKLMIGLAGFMHDVFSYTERELHAAKAGILMEMILNLKKDKKQIVIDKEGLIKRKEKEIMAFIPKQDGKNWKPDTFKWLDMYSIDMLTYVLQMVVEHRASNNASFSCPWAELFSAADRGDLNLEVIIGRIYHSKNKENTLYTIDSNVDVLLTRHILDLENPFRGIMKTINSKYIRETLWKEYGFSMHMTAVFYHLIEKFANGGYMYRKLKLNGMYMSYHKDELKEFWLEIENMIDDPSLFIKEYIKLDKNN